MVRSLAMLTIHSSIRSKVNINAWQIQDAIDVYMGATKYHFGFELIFIIRSNSGGARAIILRLEWIKSRS